MPAAVRGSACGRHQPWRSTHPGGRCLFHVPLGGTCRLALSAGRVTDPLCLGGAGCLLQSIYIHVFTPLGLIECSQVYVRVRLHVTTHECLGLAEQD